MLGLQDHLKALSQLKNYGAFLNDDLGRTADTYHLHCQNGLNFTLRSRKYARISDIDIFAEVILNDEYALRSNLKPDSVIAEIGGHIGFFTCMAAHIANQGHVYTAEANEQNFSFLQKNITNNGLKNASATHIAVSDIDGTIDLSCEDWNTGAHSMYGGSQNKLSVKSITLQNFLKDAPEHIDLMKVDCEGGEYPILLNSPAEHITRAKKIIFEQHITDQTIKEFERDSILERLKSIGYSTEVLKTIIYEGEGEFWLVEAAL